MKRFNEGLTLTHLSLVVITFLSPRLDVTYATPDINGKQVPRVALMQYYTDAADDCTTLEVNPFSPILFTDCGKMSLPKRSAPY